MEDEEISDIPSVSPIKKIYTWIILAALTAAFIAVLHLLKAAAAPLIGSVFAGIIISLCISHEIKVPESLFRGAQSIIGCMIAGVFTISVFSGMKEHWLLMIFCVFSMLFGSFILGVILAKRRVLPGSTAIWGSWPGAASAMVIMSNAYGGDMRLVAFMQYMRVMAVALAASFVATHFGIHGHAEHVPYFRQLLNHIDAVNLIFTVLIAFAGFVLSRLLRISAGPMIVSVVLGAIAVNTGLVRVAFPGWLLLATYTIVGWSIGLRFTREITLYAFKVLPYVLASIAILLVLCGVVAAAMVKISGIDPLTAYLAASPGGADSVAVIAASSKADMSFVMSVQMMRFVIVLIIGPYAAKFASKHV